MKITAPINTQVGGSGPVTAVFRQRSNGTAEVLLGLNYAKAVAPDLSYVADHVDVIPGPSAFTIIFGKMASNRQSLRTRIEIVFGKQMFQNQLIKSSRNFLTSIPAEIEEESTSLLKFPDPEKLQTFRANNVLLGASADEGVADFYYLSPADFGFAAQKQISEIRLVPSVRVTMDVRLLRDFLVQCHKFDTHPEDDVNTAENSEQKDLS